MKTMDSQENCNLSQAVAISKNSETEGFDLQAGETWIYPTNYALRDYQYNIIESALLMNTLVSLPTGLGKTFIAAVVMYNFYRWYPNGKIVFMAPTRPLVKQQIDACYNIMAIPKEVTAELTGMKAKTIRKDIWKEKRVFFVTPQVLQNDLDTLDDLRMQIKCVVFDEAHKAKGNHAYCEVMKKLSPRNEFFRVLALSATPGNKIPDVLDVIRNLQIAHLEIRTDESEDVAPYVFKRSLETVVVPLGEKLQEVRDCYLKVLEKFTRILMQHRIISGNCSTLTKGKIFLAMKDYEAKNRSGRNDSYSDIMRNLNICITLYHGYELLIRHGLRSFLSFFEEHAEKPLLRGNLELQHIMKDVQEHLGPAPNVEPLPDGTVTEIPAGSKFGHPKFYILSEILDKHFKEMNNGESRAIVFCEYRESVMEAYSMLLRQKPLIKPRIFLGQGAISQLQQINVVKAFKRGECNTLVSTCIGEEGLDVGDVDLIVCFDINSKSPIRMIQRMGRTGRKREGRVVILVTEGKEQQTLKECLIHKQNFSNYVLQSSVLYKEMYKKNPRMIPAELTPKCQKLFITVKKDCIRETAEKKSNSNLKDMFSKLSNNNLNSDMLEDCNPIETVDRIPLRKEYWNKGNYLNVDDYDPTRIDFSKRIEKMRSLQPTYKIGHSTDTKMLVSLLKFSESKKFNIPLTQFPLTQREKTNAQSTNLKQTDIRSFSNCVDHKIIDDNDSNHLLDAEKELHDEIARYLEESNGMTCKICDNLFDCSSILKTNNDTKILLQSPPDLAILDNISVDSLLSFASYLNPTPKENPIDESLKTCKLQRTIEETLDTNLKSPLFKPPSSIKKVFIKCGINDVNLDDSVFDDVSFTQIEQNAAKTNIDLKHSDVAKNQDSLNFFYLTSLDEVCSASTLPENDASMKSPVLSGSFNRSKLLKGKANRRLFPNTALCSDSNVSADLFSDCDGSVRLSEAKIDEDVDSDVDVIDTSLDNDNFGECLGKPGGYLKISDVVDLNVFGLSGAENKGAGKSVNLARETNEMRSLFDDFCGESFLGWFLQNDPETNQSSTTNERKCQNTKVSDSENKTNNQTVDFNDVDQHTKEPLGNLHDNSQKNENLETDKTTKTETKESLHNRKINNESHDRQTNTKESLCENKTNKQIVNFDKNDQQTEEHACLQMIDNLTETQTKRSLRNKKINDNEPQDKQTEDNLYEFKTNKRQLDENDQQIKELFENLRDNSLRNEAQQTNKILETITNESLHNRKTNESQNKQIETKENFCKTNKRPFLAENYQLKTETLRNLHDNSQHNENQQTSKIPATIISQSLHNRKTNEESQSTQIKSKEHFGETNKRPFFVENYQLKKETVGILHGDSQKNENRQTDKKLVTETKSLCSEKLNDDESHNKKVKTKEADKQEKNKRAIDDDWCFSSNDKKVEPILTNASVVDLTPESPEKNRGTSPVLSQFTFLRSQGSKVRMTPQNSNVPRRKLQLNKRNLFASVDGFKKGERGEMEEASCKTTQLTTTKGFVDSEGFTFADNNRLDDKLNCGTVAGGRSKKIKLTANKKCDEGVDVMDSDDDFEVPKRKENRVYSTLLVNAKKVPNNNCRFIDFEADDGRHRSSSEDDEITISQDKFEESFIDDNTENLLNTTISHAHYMQSVRSPILNRGTFKIPDRPQAYVNNVYSQLVIEDDDNNYVNDSFCVNTQKMRLTPESEVTELEAAELILKERNKRKKMKKQSVNFNKKKRARIIISSSDSD